MTNAAGYEEEYRELSIYLKKIDQDMEVLESQRQNNELLETLLAHLDNLSNLAENELQVSNSIVKPIVKYLNHVKKGDLVLTSPSFEPLFNSVALIQEQIEHFLEKGKETENSQIPTTISQLESLTLPATKSPVEVIKPPEISTDIKETSTKETPFTSAFSSFKDPRIVEIEKQSNDLLDLMKELEDITYAGDMEAIRDHLKHCINRCEHVSTLTKQSIKKIENDSLSGITEELETMVQQWSIYQGKEVTFSFNVNSDLGLENNILQAIRAAIFPLVEYLIEESLESPQNRGKKGKTGHIFLNIGQEESWVIISVSDDGKGIRTESIKNRALKKEVIDKNTLNSLSDDEIKELLFQEGMYSHDDNETGARLPEIKKVVEECSGIISLETKPEEMLAFIIAFPMKKAFSDTLSSISLPPTVSQNFTPDLESLQNSAGVVQVLMSNLEDRLTKEELQEFEQNLNYIFESMKVMLEGLSHGDINTAREATLNLSQMANVELFKEVGMMAREMHESLKEFSTMINSKFQSIAMEAIPDATHRLEYIIQTTENSANTTLDLSESIMADASETRLDIEALKEIFENQKESPNPSSMEEGLQILEMMKNRETVINEKLVNIMTAQDYQDLTGQVIRKIISLVNDLENRLISLVKTFGASLGEALQEKMVNESQGTKIEEKPEDVEETKETTSESSMDIEMYGPQHSQGKGMSNQDEVDDLLAQFGF